MTCSSLRWLWAGILALTLMAGWTLPASAQTMTRTEIKRQYRKAILLMRRDRYERASQLLFDIVENGAESPKYQRRARLRLARSLFEQKLHLVAISNVVTIMLNTPANRPSGIFRSALRGLIQIAETIGDESLIITTLRRIPRLRSNIKLPPDQDPVRFLLRPRPKDRRKSSWGQFRNSFAYFMGRSLFTLGPRYFKRSHRFLKLVKPNAKNNYYAKSLYLRAVMAAWVGKLIRSNQRFRKVLALKSNKKDPVLARIQMEAQYGVSRNFYAQARIAQLRNQGNPKKFTKKAYMKLYKRALIEYNRIPKKRKIYQDKMLFETAYTYFMMEQYHFALGQLIALNSPYYKTGFFPELDILRALIYFRTCKYESTKETVTKFLAQYQPLNKRLKTLLSYRKTKKWRAQYYDYYKRQKKLLEAKKKTEIPASVITVLERSKSLVNYEALMRKIEEERSLIRGKSSSWRESNIGKQMLRRVVRLLGILRSQAGSGLYRSLREISRAVGKQLNQARFIQLETLQNQKKELERFAEGGGIEQDEIRYTIVTEQNYIYWPFQGEYWRDEIGHYRQFIQGECKR
ncbi:MAG: hypothetical protein EP343_30855 [Deltaproteobacteria bacterium]|nr:MAG: hypothetical protein EP343_30855 [Deltaproteobacteria bacterium]